MTAPSRDGSQPGPNKEDPRREGFAAAAVAAFAAIALCGAGAALLSVLGVEGPNRKPLPFPGARAIAVALLAWPLLTWFLAAMWQAMGPASRAREPSKSGWSRILLEGGAWAGAVLTLSVLLGIIGAVVYLVLRLVAG